MASVQFSFFATKTDLLEIVTPTEEEFAVKYVEMGLFGDASTREFRRLDEIPGIGITNSPGAPTVDNHYLLVPGDSTIQTRQVPQRKGGMRWSIDMISNPDSVELSPGGAFSRASKILIIGRCSTFGATDFSRDVYHALLSRAKKSFHKIDWVYVGKEAAGYYENGWRLVRDSRLPESHDLVFSA